MSYYRGKNLKITQVVYFLAKFLDFPGEEGEGGISQFFSVREDAWMTV